MRLAFFLYLLIAGSNGFCQSPSKIESTLQVVDVDSKKITAVYKTSRHIEAPNWSKDGGYFIVNADGRLYKIRSGKDSMEIIKTAFADSCNNDHGISPNGKQLAISYNRKQTEGPAGSAVYLLPVGGGVPKLITELSPSYWHGWSPDGSALAYCAERNSNYDVYTISVKGGKEKRLTTTEGLDDGPDYSVDGKFIYFNSFRSGRMQLWRMKPDGSEPEQLTNDEYSNWFAHPSPDGKWIVFISYLTDQGQAHPFGKEVKLRLMSLKDRGIHDLTTIFTGGQGTINVPSWSPDSKRVAFISYRLPGE